MLTQAAGKVLNIHMDLNSSYCGKCISDLHCKHVIRSCQLGNGGIHLGILALRRVRQEDHHEFKASLDYMVKPCPQK